MPSTSVTTSSVHLRASSELGSWLERDEGEGRNLAKWAWTVLVSTNKISPFERVPFYNSAL